MDKIVDIQNIDPNSFQLQDYNSSDTSLISNFTQPDIVFNPSEDYVEYFIFDLNQNILFSDTAGYGSFKLIDNNITIDPQLNLESEGYTEGQYYTLYNFLKRKLSSSPNSTFYIQDISSDRTELRLNTTKIPNVDIVDLTTQFAIQIANAAGTYIDFYLNFGNNQLVIANNIALDDTDPNDPTVLIKLYEPLPSNFDTNAQCWVVEKISDSVAYQISLTTVFNVEEQYNYIGGPNYNIDIQDQINNSTPYYNYNTLSSNTSLLGSGSLLSQINSLLVERGIEINIDYSDYSQFINFSSAQTRLENFYYKLALIEEYTFSASYSSNTNPNTYVSNSQVIWQNKINDIITNFDGYEYYLYYESESHAWPKTNSVYPYQNYSVNSSTALNWFATQSITASLYDDENDNALIYSIPTYLREDSDNDQYFLFVQMIGQHFDNIWTYLKDVTNKFDADNRLNYGISKDIVAQALRDLGIKIYQNNFSSNDLYSALLGITPSGSLFNVPNITGSLPTPTGLEYINTFVTASATGSLEPVDDINKEIYKRIYHNLPMLLKKKGSVEGLRMLINTYGIPDTILRLNEFGGNSSKNQAWDNFVDQFNYALEVTSTSGGSGYVSTYIDNLLNPNLIPTTFAFRFKPTPIADIDPNLVNTTYSQVLFNTLFSGFSIILTYSGSNSGSYSGSITSSNNIYGELVYVNTANFYTCSVSLPFFNGDWWSVMLTTDLGAQGDHLYVANKEYNGYDGNQIGFQATSSYPSSFIVNYSPIYTNPFDFISLSNFTYTETLYGRTCYTFSGSFQEFRIYGSDYNSPVITPLSVFNDYVMNPYSIEGITPTGSLSSFNTLAFRAPLGTVLDNDVTQTTRTSIHPAISQYPPTQSFYSIGSSDYTLNGAFNFVPNTEVIYQDQFNMGIKNSISEKIRIITPSLPSGNTLSQYISIQQHSHVSESFTKDVNYFEAAFSPQDEVNDDIIAQLGSFNIGDYIGDPRNLVNSTLTYYPDFNKLRDYYFSKYTHSYDLNDYIRLIKFYDNSLFKMIKDFVPAKTGLASGIVIKSTLLERQRYPVPQATTNSTIAFVGSPTTKTINIAY